MSEAAGGSCDHRIYLAPQTVAVVQAVQSENLPWVFPSPKREAPLQDVRKAIEWGNLTTPELYHQLFVQHQGQLSIFELLGINTEEKG